MKTIMFLLCLLPTPALAINCTMVEKADHTEVVCVGDPAGSNPGVESQQPPAVEQPAPPDENAQPEQPAEGEQTDQPSQ